MATPVVMAIGKETSNPLIFNDSPLTGVYTPGSDENRLKLKQRNWCTLCHMLLQRLVAEKIIYVAAKEVQKYFDPDSYRKNSKQSFLEVLKWYAWIKGKTHMLKTKTQRKLEVKQVEFKLGEDCWVKVLMLSKYCLCSKSKYWSSKSQGTARVKVKEQRTAV